MKRIVLIGLMVMTSGILAAQPLTREQTDFFTRQMMDQQKNWNLGDIDGYMSYYWGSDSLMFFSQGTVKKGWQNIRDGYETKYPDAAAMGVLEYNKLTFYMIDKKTLFCTGTWKIDRSKETLRGTFTLIWKKIKGRWVITMDHTE